MQLTLHVTRRTPHGASRLVRAMSAWSVKTRHAPSGHCRDARVYGHTTTAMHEIEYISPIECTPSPPQRYYEYHYFYRATSHGKERRASRRGDRFSALAFSTFPLTVRLLIVKGEHSIFGWLLSTKMFPKKKNTLMLFGFGNVTLPVLETSSAEKTIAPLRERKRALRQ